MKLTQAQYDLLDWQLRPGMLGSFKRGLWDLMARADRPHLEKIAAGFPDEVEQYLMYTTSSGYWPTLRRHAEENEGY